MNTFTFQSTEYELHIKGVCENKKNHLFNTHLRTKCWTTSSGYLLLVKFIEFQKSFEIDTDMAQHSNFHSFVSHYFTKGHYYSNLPPILSLNSDTSSIRYVRSIFLSGFQSSNNCAVQTYLYENQV